MRNLIYLFIGAAILSVSACTGKHDDATSNTIFVNVDVKQQSPLTDFICSERHVCLETNDSCILAAGGFYGFAGDTIVMEYNSEIYLFNPSGKYISSFNHHGRGPGEYTGIYGLRVYDREIYVMDRDIKKIFRYSLDGQLINEINLEYSFWGFDVKSKDRIVLASAYRNMSMAQFVIIDSNSGEAIAKICPYDVCHTIGFWDFIPFSGRKGDDIFANIPFSHCTYRVGAYDIDSVACYQFNTELQLPKVDIKSMDIEEVSDVSKNENVVRHLGYFFPAENCYYQTYLLFGKYGYKNHLLKYDLEGKVLAQRMMCGFDEDYPYFDDIRGIVDGEIICIRNADILLTLDERRGKTYWEEQGLTDDSNPVIFFYKLKES